MFDATGFHRNLRKQLELNEKLVSIHRVQLVESFRSILIISRQMLWRSEAFRKQYNDRLPTILIKIQRD